MALITPIKVPLISVNDTSLTVVDIPFAYGSQVKAGDTVLVFETSKTTYDVVAETAGYIAYFCEANREYEVNFLVANIYGEQSEVPEKAATATSYPLVLNGETIATKAITAWEGTTLFSTAALGLMELHGVQASSFAGKDFADSEDLNAFLGIGKKPVLIAEPITKKAPSIAIDTNKVTVEKLSANKKTEINYLSAVQSAGLTSTINAWVDTEGIFVHINQSLKLLKNSLLPVILYESARLLKKYKALNAYFTGDGIAFYNQVHVGFAIDINKGLKVLKIADTNTKGINVIEQEIIELSNKYLDDTLHISELTDIGFTITDLSGEDVAFFRPLVNMMNSAILGVSSIDAKLNRCMLSLSFDHRVTEGKLAAQFLHELTTRLSSYQSKHHPLLNQHITCFKCFKQLQEDISSVGFAKCITPKGEEAYICQSCLKGF